MEINKTPTKSYIFHNKSNSFATLVLFRGGTKKRKHNRVECTK